VYARSEGASGVLYMSTGGRNIEASLLALLSILLLGTRAYPIAAGIAFLTSATMLSRAGLVGAAVSIGIAAYRARKTRSYYLYTFVGIAMVVLIGGLVVSSVVDIPVLDRFNLQAETQLEHKNVGRLALWNSATQALEQNLFGYGVGNGVPLMEQISGLNFVENNVHDIYLQFLLEGGVQSLLLFVVMVGHILFRPAEGQQRNIKAFLLCYLMLAFIEFSGYEAYFWFFVGMFYARNDMRRVRLRQESGTKRPRHAGAGPPAAGAGPPVVGAGLPVVGAGLPATAFRPSPAGPAAPREKMSRTGPLLQGTPAIQVDHA
jgi:O-antigen ligase